MPMNANRMAMKATAAEGVAKSRGVGYQESVRILIAKQGQRIQAALIRPRS